MAIQVSSGSQREKWVAVFLPATAILLVAFMYITFYALPAFNETEREYNSVVSGGVGPEVVASLQAEADALRREQAQLQRTIRLVDDEVIAKSEGFKQLSPTAKHSAVTALCRKLGVAVVQDQAVNDIRLPTLRSDSIETLQTLISKDATSFRELTLSADYPTIVTLMQELPKVPGVIPISVKLTKKTNSNATDSSGVFSSPAVSWTVGLLM
jgi:hypothetical protein